MTQPSRARLVDGVCRLRQLISRQYAGLLCALLLGGCSSVGYYSQLGRGHFDLMQRREPIENVLADPNRDAELRRRLALVLRARRFASSDLALPDNRSYRLYADIQRPQVLWNLFVTPEFSLEPQLHCFPVAGCVAYRGFYDLDQARGAAALEQQAGMDSWIGGVEAYSTLGWFDDPIVSSMLQRDDQHLAALIFHELAHQQLYVGDDSAFNESFASFVEQEGLRQWLASRTETASDPQHACRREQFTRLVMETRSRLERLYAADLPAEQMRIAKQAEFERLRSNYRQWRDSRWQVDGRYDAWVDGPLNNAKLLPFGLYEQWVPAFAELFRQSGRDWSVFYQQVQLLADVPPATRQQRLQRLQSIGTTTGAAELGCIGVT